MDGECTIGVYPLLSTCMHSNGKKIVTLHFQKAGAGLFERCAAADNRIVYSIRVLRRVIRSVLG